MAGLAVYVVKVPRRVVGALAGYGAGALLGAIAFDLIPEGEELRIEIALWLLIGAAVFVVADWLVETRFGGEGSAETPPRQAERARAATTEGARPRAARSGSWSARWSMACPSRSSSGSSSLPVRA